MKFGTYIHGFRFFLLWIVAMGAQAGTFSVALSGDDTGPGTEAQPWRTIQHAANSVHPGDTVVVQAGTYNERVTTGRGGTSARSRIVFQAASTVTMKGWRINHPYVSVRGFDIKGHSHPSSSEGYVRVGADGDYFELRDCAVRDGIGIGKSDITFVAPNKIVSPSGGFLAAGFADGQTITVNRADTTTVTNRGTFIVGTVTDGELALVQTTIVNEGPKPCYISGANHYAVYTASGTEGCTFRENIFSNLSYRYWFVQGTGHLFHKNIVEHNNGWDVIYFVGSNHTFHDNSFINNGLGVYLPSPDIFDNWPARYERITFSRNFVENFAGVINAQKDNDTNSGPLYVTDNVFLDVGRFVVEFSDTYIERNTFLRVAKVNTLLRSRGSHPLYINSAGNVRSTVIRNNVFVDCGEPNNIDTLADVGWYEISGLTDGIVTTGNFVASGPPGYAAKNNWLEGVALLNGGDPGFVDVNNPVGEDALPFSEDDGLRLRPDSKLIGAGSVGATPGAYANVLAIPRLDLEWLGAGQVAVRWPNSGDFWMLQSSPDLAGSWEYVLAPAVLQDGTWKVIMEDLPTREFFRLMR